MPDTKPQTSATPSTFKHPLELALEALHELDQTAHITLKQRPIVTRAAHFIQRAIRDTLVKEQEAIAMKLGAPTFMPSDGLCYRCRTDLFEGVRLGQQRHLITGCSQCHVSFCD
jgi:hypothetical protein